MMRSTLKICVLLLCSLQSLGLINSLPTERFRVGSNALSSSAGTKGPFIRVKANNDHLVTSYLNGRQLAVLRAGASADYGQEAQGETKPSLLGKLKSFVNKNFFLCGMLVAVSLAKSFPSIGKSGGILRPELFIGKLGVSVIFLLSGLSMDVSELKRALSNVKLNALVQLSTFLAWPFLIGVPLNWLLRNHLPQLLPPALVEGLLILSCLPTTINMCVILANSAGGSTASAICNAVISNIAGIFLTPALLLYFFGASIQLPFIAMIMKLCKQVLLPVTVGQLLRTTPMKEAYTKRKKGFKRLQEMVLLGIVYNAFCNTFTKGIGLALNNGLILLVILPVLHLGSMAASFKIFSSPSLDFDRQEIVSGILCASQKTLAFGLPLINTVFEGNPNLAAYCAPIMFIHPLQLTLGSLLVPKFAEYISEGEES